MDATIGESCRLADYKVTRKAFETSDVQVKPAVALSGAAGLFAADLVAIRYTNWLERFPLLFNVAQVCVRLRLRLRLAEKGWFVGGLVSGRARGFCTSVVVVGDGRRGS